MSSSLEFEIQGHIGVIRLNRPEFMNTFTTEMANSWSEAYRQCDANDEVRAVVVTGNGKAFCAGADMSGGADTFDTQSDMTFSSSPVLPAFKIRKPVIAALNGHAIGVGLGLALQCDFRIAANEGKYGLLQVRRGVLADACSHWILPRLIGMEKALKVIMLGEKMTGAELVEMGLAMESLPAEQVFSKAMALAESLATESAPVVAAMAKRLVWQSFDMSLAEMQAKETAWLHHSMGMADSLEGGAAFFEKRQPRWQGKLNGDFPEK